MRKIFFLLFYLYSSQLFAANEYDSKLLKLGIVDSAYQVIDWDKYNELLRITTNNLAPLLPRQTDAYTTLIGLTVDKFGIRYSYILKGMESKDDYASYLSDPEVIEGLKNLMCGPNFAKSETFKNNGGDSIQVLFLSKYHKQLGEIGFTSKDCNE